MNNSVKDILITRHNDISTATAVVSLNAGDRVFIRVHIREGDVKIYSYHRFGRSTFSGRMLN